MISTIYDPLATAVEIVLGGQKTLHKICQLKVGWDEKIPENLKKVGKMKYQNWKTLN